MMQSPQTKRASSTFSLALLVLLAAPCLRAEGEPSQSWMPTSLQKAGQIALFLSFVRFYSRIPKEEPDRYSMDELMNGENLSDNLWYFVDDGIIGQRGKKPSLHADPITGRIEACAGAWPKGLYGWTHAYWKPVVTAAALVVACKTLSCEKVKALISEVLTSEKNVADVVIEFMVSFKSTQ